MIDRQGVSFMLDAVGQVSTRTPTMAGVTAPVSKYNYTTPWAFVLPGAWSEWAVNDLVTPLDHSRGGVPRARRL